MRLLIIEDERGLAEAMAQLLVKHHHSVDLRFDGVSGLELALANAHDAIILDIMLPGRDGLSVLRELRAAALDTPVILLTARSQTNDKVRGLDAGADDYLTKPFKMAELLARLRAIARRRGESIPGSGLEMGDLTLDLHSLTMRRGSVARSLTLKEAQLLELLLRNRNQTLGVEQIASRVWGYESEAGQRHVQVYISFLRKKLAQLGTQLCIVTVRGVGYRLQLEEIEGQDV